MRIYSLQNTEFTGRLKHGDLLKKLNHLNEVAKVKALKVSANCEASSDSCLHKTFQDPENLTPFDKTKICASGTGLGTSTVSGRAATITDALNTWSIYSMFS